MATQMASEGTPDAQSILDDFATRTQTGALASVQSATETWRGGAGQTGSQDVDPRSRFGIASITKTFVATVALQLVGEGRLALDDPVERWLPGAVSGDTRITIRQLMNHTSGLRDQQGPLAPGVTHHYANGNYLNLGHIVETVTGHTIDTEVRDRIFKPLQLADTSYGPAAPAADGPGAPRWLGRQAPSSGRVDGAVGIVSTADDLATFYRALLTGLLLGEEQLAEMLTTVDTTGDPLAAQGVSGRAGLGIFEISLDCGVTWGHGGDSDLYSDQVLASRDASKIVVVARNARGWASVQAVAAELYCLEA